MTKARIVKPCNPANGSALVPIDWDHALALVIDVIRHVVTERHRKYGPGNIRRFGERGLLVRSEDKLARLIGEPCPHCGQPVPAADADDETIDDAWGDLSGLAMAAIMLRWGWWELPMSEPEAWWPKLRRKIAVPGDRK